MKTALKFFIGLSLLASIALLVYAVWFIGESTADFPTLDTDAVAAPGRLDVRMTLEGTDRAVAITSITVPRAVRDSLELEPPAGFTEEPLPHDPGETDAEARQFVEDFNEENVRFVGHFELSPGEARTLSFPAQDPDGGSGRIELGWERSIGVGGGGGFFRVLVNLDR